MPDVPPSGRRAVPLLAFFLTFLFLSSAAVADPPHGRVRSLAEIRHAGVVMQKWDLSCGSAALATLLTYDLADPVGEREVAAAMVRQTGPMRVRSRGGFSLLNMKEYLEARGYQAEGYGELAFEDLVERLPAIVPVNFHGYEHFVVVRAVREGKVLLGDPAFGRRTMRIEKFKTAWQSRIAFVVSAP